MAAGATSQRLSSATEGVQKMRFTILAIVIAVVVGFASPASADERPSDPFENYTTEINKDAPLVRVWDSLRHQIRLEKAYFYECLQSAAPTCRSSGQRFLSRL